jgi:hypothetical protein
MLSRDAGEEPPALPPAFPTTKPEAATSAEHPPTEGREPMETCTSLSQPPPPFAFHAGCYIMHYTPQQHKTTPLVHYDGTMRVQWDEPNVIASGDLYIHQPCQTSQGQKSPKTTGRFMPMPNEPDPASGIPIFPIKQYRYYVRVIKISESSTGKSAPCYRIELKFKLHRFNHATRTWTNEGTFSALLNSATPPPRYPSTSDYWEGEVRDSSKVIVGSLTLGWVSNFLRRAVIEIDKVSASEWPLNNGDAAMPQDWRTIFALAGWDITLVQSNSNVTEPSGESWSESELHAGMLAWRDSSDLDHQWRYHLMCVRRLDMTTRGLMYDSFGGDSNNIPREGAAIASHWIFPDEDPWGKCKGVRLGKATPPYFRTAIHEIGHAMLLYHATRLNDNHILQVTPQVAENAMAAGIQFPDNIEWSYRQEDEHRLRHMPDIYVRPGGAPFGTLYGTIPISSGDVAAGAKGLELRVFPLLEAVPIGAPVRVNIELVNTSKHPMLAPSSLDMKAGRVRGLVINPSGVARTFSPVVRVLDTDDMSTLKPGGSIKNSLTLLRGAQGALFPSQGSHRIVVEATWNTGEKPVTVKGEAIVMVTPPVDDVHAKVALKILSTPDALLTLALGGDHLKEGMRAIQEGLGHPTLKPHYAFIEAKRVGRRFGKRKADMRGMANLLDEGTVMSPDEIKGAAKMVLNAEGKATGDAMKRIAGVLQKKAKKARDPEIVKMVDSL